MGKKFSLSDMPLSETLNDFGVEGYVKGLERFIGNAATPLTIALQGEWGSGKTSLMNRLNNDLCAEGKDFIGININTWEYSMLASPEETVIKIIGKLVTTLSENDSQATSKAGQYMRGVLNFAYRFGREAMKGLVPGAGLVIEGVGVPSELPGSQNEEKSISLSELKKTLTEAVQKTVTDFNKKGVIVFVDDLDRLNPPLAVQILELLKNIFTLENCIFVLAIDYDVVVKGLEPKFGKLTDTNEREFRSFFDKIIQVPFSLPVNNYRPMDFLLRSLVDVGYISALNSNDPNVRRTFSKIVEASVGKNPRSIKRLINTLSLLDCIAQSSSDTKNEEMSMEDKQLNFIAVAIQICYPKIYRMLSQKPGFTTWDVDFALKMGIKYHPENGEDKGSQWEDIVDAACQSDAYLSKHQDDIVQLLSLVIDILSKTNQASEENLSNYMKKILDKSSITGVDTDFKAEELDKKDLIGKIHRNLYAYIKEKRPEIEHIQLKRNTGNGGIYIYYNDTDYIDVTFTPSVNRKNQIALRLWMHFHWPRPERMKGLTFDEIMQDSTVAEAINSLDAVITPLLHKDTWYFHGRTYDGNKTYFPSYVEELRYIHQNGWMDGDITNNPQFWIDLDKPSFFEDKQIVATIGNLILANYDFRKAMQELR
jgi:hypothetical protein